MGFSLHLLSPILICFVWTVAIRIIHINVTEGSDFVMDFFSSIKLSFPIVLWRKKSQKSLSLQKVNFGYVKVLLFSRDSYDSNH